METTSMSSRGQVVIPFDIRKQLKLEEGEKFVVIAQDDIIILKKIEMPSFEDFNELIGKTRQFARNKNIKKRDLTGAIKRARQ